MKTKSFKLLFCLLAALGTAALAPAYTYILNTDTNLPLRWVPGTIAMRIYADSTAKLSDGSTAAQSIQAALQNWNGLLGDEQFTSTVMAAGAQPNTDDGDNHNEVFFASTSYGMSFDSSTLAVTTTWALGNERTEADTIFNTAWTWDSYRDGLGNHPSRTIDIQRVATHEFGHNLGLDHPDQATPPQSVSSIMHSTISNIILPTADDIAGVQNLYGPNPLGSVPVNDNFANAITMTLTNNAATVTGFNVNATKQAGEPNNAGNVGGRSIWWKWTAPSNGSVNLDTGGSYNDTTLGVYTGTTVTGLTVIASNDDVQDGVIQHSAVSFNVVSGTVYYFMVDGFNGGDADGADAGAVTLNLAFTAGSGVAPTISSQPAGATADVGASVTFSVTASGTPAPTYQWKKGGTNIPGATANIYTIPHVALTDAGSYTVAVTNSVNSVTSNAAVLTVRAINNDFNADGESDLIWQDTSTGERSVWLMNGTAFQSNAGLGTVGTDWSIAASADFNGDGKPDLVWQNTATGERSIWLMNGTSFVSNVSLGIVSNQWSITGAGDFNGDGKPDIVFQNRVTGERAIWLMNGTAFSSTVSLGIMPIEWSIAATGDFNADGKTDLLWTNTRTGQIAVWLMNGTSYSSGVTLGSVPLRYQIAGVGDYNADGNTDIIFTDTLTGDRSVWLMNGTAYVNNVYIANLPIDLTLDHPVSRHAQADFNADANSDLVWQNTVTGDRLIWLMEGTSYLSSSPLGNVSTNWMIAANGDFNADGKTDLVWQNTSTGERSIWLMDGTQFTSGVSLGVVSTAWSIAGAGDFNGDGQTDILWQNTSTGERLLWLMNGTSFGSGVSLGTISTNWSIVGSADFNGDGKPDILWQNSATGECVIWVMNGTALSSTVSLGTAPAGWSIVGTGDFNADGSADIVWQNASTGERLLWLMNGTSYGTYLSLGTVSPDWSIRN